MTFVSGLVVWGLMISFYTTQQCELFGGPVSQYPGSRIGGGFIGTFVAWMMTVLSIALEFVDEKRWFSCCGKDDDPSVYKKRRKHSHRRRGSSGEQQRRSRSGGKY